MFFKVLKLFKPIKKETTQKPKTCSAAVELLREFSPNAKEIVAAQLLELARKERANRPPAGRNVIRQIDRIRP